MIQNCYIFNNLSHFHATDSCTGKGLTFHVPLVKDGWKGNQMCTSNHNHLYPGYATDYICISLPNSLKKPNDFLKKHSDLQHVNMSLNDKQLKIIDLV